MVLLAPAACHKKAPVAVTPPAPAPQTSEPAAPPPVTPVTPVAPVAPVSQRRARTTPASATAPAPDSPATAPAAPQPEFKLGRAMSEDEQRAYNTEIDRRIQHATQILESISNRTLTVQQKSSLAQIQGFISQAGQMRSTDLVRARSLAERADILTEDLASTLK